MMTPRAAWPRSRLRLEDYGTHSLRRIKVSVIYKRTGNLRAVQIHLNNLKSDCRSPYHPLH